MDNFDMEEIRAHRREMAEKTMRSSSTAEARGLIDQIFDGRTSHPWYQTCVDFLSEHSAEAVLRGELPDHHAFIYFPKSNKGMWYKAEAALEAVGMLHGNGLKTLAEIAASKNLAK
jgi:hypothetical protein